MKIGITISNSVLVKVNYDRCDGVTVEVDEDSKNGTATGPNAVGESRKANSFKGRDVRLASGTRLVGPRGRARAESSKPLHRYTNSQFRDPP